jgi:hypothetical protein
LRLNPNWREEFKLIDRRAFVRRGAAFAVAGATWQWPVATGAAPRFEVPGVAVVDRGLKGWEPFAAAARARGIRVVGFSGDAASAWMREIEPRLRAGGVIIEAYTSAATQFCLDFLARDYGARTVHRAETDAAVAWVLSSSPLRRGALAPRRSSRRESHA